MSEAFSVESILFKDTFSNTSSNVKVNASKSMDELVYDAYKSEEDLKFFETYDMLNTYNTNQKIHMLKRLNNITNNIRNKNISNSCESYIRSLEEEYVTYGYDKETKGNVITRVWKTIVEFCERVLNAIVNFVKMVFNAIASMNSKKQLEDYKKYTALKLSNDKIAEIDKQPLKSNKFKVKYSELNSSIEKFNKAYDDSISECGYKVLDTNHDAIKEFMNTKKILDGFKKNMLTSVFGSKANPDENTSDMKQKLNEYFYDATSDSTCGYMKTLTEDFKCFADGGFINKIHEVCKKLKLQEKKFTDFTKSLKNDIKEQTDDALKNKPEYGAISKANVSSDSKNLYKQLVTYRIKFNMFASSLSMDFERHVIKYVNTAYKAMKMYLNAAGKDTENKDTENKNA